MKHLLCACILFITGSLFAAGFPVTGTVTASALYLRTGPNKYQYSPVKNMPLLYKGLRIQILSLADENPKWGRVRATQKGVTAIGYCHLGYIRYTMPATPPPADTYTPPSDNTPIPSVASGNGEIHWSDTAPGSYPRTLAVQNITPSAYTAVKFEHSNRVSYMFKEKLSVDADGSPHAYHPQNKGIDYLANAGRPGNWWGIVTENGKSSGTPYVAPSGYYVSCTSLTDPSKNRKDQSRYVNAETVPYIVLSNKYRKSIGALVGDFAFVLNLSNDKYTYAIFADVGPGLGEGSIALAQALGINSSPKRGGTSKKELLYIVFPATRKKPGWTVNVQAESEKLFREWGGFSRLNSILNRY